MKVRQPKHHIMLRQENAALRYVRKSLRGAQHKYGRNITGIAKPIRRSRAIFLPQQRQRHVRPPKLTMNHGPIRHRPLIHRHVRRQREQQSFQLLVIEMVRHRPGYSGAACPTEIAVHRTGAELQAPRNSALAQIVSEPQAQHFAYLPHRQSLSRHPDPLLLAKGSILPSVEDRQRNRPAIATTAAFMITGIGVHDPPEFAFTINWNRCSRSTGFSVHDPPEHAERVWLEPKYK